MASFYLISHLLVLIFSTKAAFGLGLSVGVGIGGGTTTGLGGVWIGGGSGINTPNSPPPQQQEQSPPPSSQSPTSSSDSLSKAYTSLQAWKSAITEDPNGVVSSWVGPNVCNYKGVFCSSNQDSNSNSYSNDSPVVSAIDLNHANLKGILVKELSLLTDLSLLHLNSNRFSGTIPESFKQFEYLTELDLSNNQFSGTFPTCILNMPNLLYLDIRFNKFYGSIPDDLFSKQLDAIMINNNKFTGELPHTLGNSAASVINLSNNQFTGAIPASFSYVNPSLKEILFLNNQLSGCIPDSLGLLSDITVLDISNNSLMGHLPDSLSCLENIEVLNLAHNKLSGEVPDLVCSLRTLLNLSVEYNFFSGFSQKCTNLFIRSIGFDFSLNCIPGKGMQRPEPDCSLVPGISDGCLRIPSPKALVCGDSLLQFILNLGNVPIETYHIKRNGGSTMLAYLYAKYANSL